MNFSNCPCLRVLVVDSEPNDRYLTTCHLTQALLNPTGLVVECAAEGLTALDMIRSESFVLALLSWEMATLTGYEILNTMRREGSRVPVVILSGHHRNEIEKDLDLLGAVFLNKNEINPDSLIRAIATAIRQQEANAEPIPLRQRAATGGNTP